MSSKYPIPAYINLRHIYNKGKLENVVVISTDTKLRKGTTMSRKKRADRVKSCSWYSEEYYSHG